MVRKVGMGWGRETHSFQKQQKGSVWGAGRIIGFNRMLHILPL